MEMSVSTFQKITFLSCLVFCVSLFLPRILFSKGKKDIIQPKLKVGPGHAPPVSYTSPFPAEGAGRQVEDGATESYHTELMSRVKRATKPTLLAQVIPVYGFGIFLYIIYIFFKLTHTPTKQEHTVPISTQPTAALAATCHYGALNPSEAAPIQASLTRMEGVTAESTSKAFRMSARARRRSRQRDCRKLPLLKESMRVLLEGRPLEGVSPEREAEETPYTLDWEGYSEETFPQVSFCGCRRFPSVILEEPDVDVPTAEELAERMEREEEEEEEDAEEDKEMSSNELLGEDKGGDTENSPTQLKDDDKTEEEEDYDEEEDEDESCDPGAEEEEEETNLKIQQETEEGYGAEMVEEGDDEEDNQQAKEEENGEEEMSEEHPCLPHKSVSVEKGVGRNRKQITFSDHRRVFHYPNSGTVGCEYEDVEEWPNKDYIEDDDKYEDDEDNDDDDFEEKDGQDEGEKEVLGRPEEDPLMEAESLGFSTAVEWEPEEQEIDLVDFLLTYQPDTTITSNQSASTRPEAPPSGTLRMRNKKQKKEH